MIWPRATRAAFVLMALGRYGFGDHVTDGEAFSLRLANILRSIDPLVLPEDGYRAFTDDLGNYYLIRDGSVAYTDGIA